ncbi:alpha/beta fold hydrolase [SAR202 cluster bacterium AC-647-N09_OGT_505m]|nr:alpha/beta fold hydrolase [SAR202 cluster bacterium AC-647-N09_OGT_505m]
MGQKSPVAEHYFATVDGIRTHYVAAGEGPPLLLLHGLSASLIAWAPNIEPLSQKFTVYALDMPGRGDSDKPNIDYRVPAAAGFIKKFMDVLGIERASLAGCSMGGMIALRTALDYPDRVENLVLVDAAGLGRELTWYVRFASLPLVGEILQTPSLRGTSASLKYIFYNHSLIQEGFLHEIYRRRKLPGAKQAELKMIRGAVGLHGVHKQWIMTEDLRHLDIPILIVWGAQDRIIPVNHAHNAAREAPGVKLHVFDQCGHWPQMEKSREFNQLVSDFLSEQ